MRYLFHGPNGEGNFTLDVIRSSHMWSESSISFSREFFLAGFIGEMINVSSLKKDSDSLILEKTF